DRELGVFGPVGDVEAGFVAGEAAAGLGDHQVAGDELDGAVGCVDGVVALGWDLPALDDSGGCLGSGEIGHGVSSGWGTGRTTPDHTSYFRFELKSSDLNYY